MTKGKTYAIAAAIFVAFATNMAAAEPAAYEFDKRHTSILFFVSHFGFSNVQGEFLEFDGRLLLDEERPEASSLEVTIYPWSVDTDVDALNDHLRRADFFDVNEHPAATFKSTGIERTGEDRAVVTGELTLLGVTKPISLDVKLNKIGDHPASRRYAAGFSAQGKVKRSDFGMSYGLPVVGDEVTLRIETETLRIEEEGAEGG